MQYQEVTLETLNLGAPRELFEEAWERLLKNVGDENTSPKAVRRLVLEIRVKPNEKRDSAITTVSVKEHLAPLNPHEHFVQFSTDGRRIRAFTTDPGQQGLGLEDGEKGNMIDFAAAAGGGS